MFGRPKDTDRLKHHQDPGEMYKLLVVQAHPKFAEDHANDSDSEMGDFTDSYHPHRLSSTRRLNKYASVFPSLKDVNQHIPKIASGTEPSESYDAWAKAVKDVLQVAGFWNNVETPVPKPDDEDLPLAVFMEWIKRETLSRDVMFVGLDDEQIQALYKYLKVPYPDPPLLPNANGMWRCIADLWKVKMG